MQKERKNIFVSIRKGISNWVTSANFDMFFIVIVMILLCIGLVMVFSASFANALFTNNDSYFYIKKQLLFAGIGLVAMFLISKINYNILRVLAFPMYLITLGLLVLVLFIGQRDPTDNIRRWINLGAFNFQPSELAKISVIILIALFISVNYAKMKTFKIGILIPGGITLVAGGLVVIEPHLSGAILVCFVGLILMIIGGSNLKFFAALSLISIGVFAFVITNTHYMTERINIWLNPASDPQGGGWQTLQSLYAIGSGGFFGLGLGGSRQKYQYIPMPQNDYIFSIVCEELGFIGAAIIIVLFALLIYRGFVIAWSAPDKFGSLLVVGIISQVAIQTLLNIAVVTNTIPVTGISLPFFSYGGTSLTFLLAEMGIVLSVSRYSRLAKE